MTVAPAEDFLARAGWQGAAREEIAGDASARRFLRLRRGADTAILMLCPPDETGPFRAFIRLSEWLRSLGLSAPEVFAADEGAGLLLVEDLGDGLVGRLASDDPTRSAELYRAALDVLLRLHDAAPPPGLDALDPARMGQMVEITLEEADLAGTSLPGLIAETCAAQLPAPDRCALRDFHAGNLLWLPGRAGPASVGLIDFQDAVLAPPGYDLASLVDDVRRDVPPAMRAELIETFAARTGTPAERMAERIDILSLQRNLRILGVFARLARTGKPGYLAFQPRTAALIRATLARTPALASLRAPVEAVLAACGLAAEGTVAP